MAETRTALVFDYDGVIADTEPLHWKSWAALLSPYGLQLSWEEYRRLGHGVDDAGMYQVLREKAPLPNEAEFIARNRERKLLVRKWSVAQIPILPETIALLKTLGAYPIGLVTSSERSDVEPVLRAAQILDRFDAIVFGEDAAEAKPSPAPYRLAAMKLGVTTGIAFEDSVPGLASAQAAGFIAMKVEHPKDLPQIVARSLAGGTML